MLPFKGKSLTVKKFKFCDLPIMRFSNCDTCTHVSRVYCSEHQKGVYFQNGGTSHKNDKNIKSSGSVDRILFHVTQVFLLSRSA